LCLPTSDLLLAALLLPAVQGMRANEYPSDPAGALEAWARTRWPAAGQRLYQWSYQVSPSDEIHLTEYASAPLLLVVVG
jgi:hypothetical protein